MLCLKLKTPAAVIVMMFLAVVVYSGPILAGTDLSNVAWNRPVDPNSYGGPWYGRKFAENSDGYVVVDGDDARELINDDIVGNTSWAYPRNDNGGAWIDLGSTYDIASIELFPQTSSLWSQLEYATVYGSTYKTTAADYSFIIPNKGSSDYKHAETVNWHDVRYIRVVDESDVYIGVGDENFLQLSEIRVVAPVTTYSNYLGGVTANASTYNNSALYSPEFLVNNQGMSDQHGPVGYTAASSAPNTGLWMTPNYGTDGFVDRAITFDLGGPRVLDRMRIWNFNQSTWSSSGLDYIDHTDRGICEALIEYSQDGGDTYIAFDDTNGTALGNYTIAKALTYSDGSPRNNSYQLSTALGDIVADHVRITIKGNYGNSYYAGLSEVRFYGSIPYVPGDTNNDALVDETDMQTVSEWWGANVTAGDISKGDFNNDGLVDAKDASILAAHWGWTYTESAEAIGSTVPEPSALVLLVTLALGGLLSRRPH